jgi:hypothetical protein
MPKIKPAEPEAPELSPARAKLLMLQEQRADKLAAVNAETTAANRLDSIHTAVGPAIAALGQFAAAAALSYASWARGNVNGKPKPTTSSSRRDVLVRALADAEQSSAAASVAQAEFQAAAVSASVGVGRIEIAIREAAKLVAVEEATALLPKITDAIAKADSLRRQLDAARDAISSGFEFGSADYNEAQAALHDFDNARGIAEARPMSGNDGYGEDWRRFLAALEQSAGMDFEGAQATAVQPTPFNPSAPDLATAAMRAVMAFPSTGVQR